MDVKGLKHLARGQGIFNVVNGAWPLVHLRSFEAVFGPKTDRWLVRTVAGLLLTNGVVQLRSESPEALRQARALGIGTALTLGAIDLAYAPAGRISRLYLLDALVEAAWVVAWAASCRAAGGEPRSSARMGLSGSHPARRSRRGEEAARGIRHPR